MSAGPGNESFGDEITYRQGIPISIFRKSIEPVVLLSVFDPNLLVAKDTN
jgi:hypothetical protein